MGKKIELLLPWPPTVNTYWRRVRLKTGVYTTLLSKHGRIYLEDLKAAVVVQKGAVGLVGSLSVAIEARPPDDRRRDLDNLLKAPLDGLAKAGVYEDDSQIDDLRIKRGKKLKNGALRVLVAQYEPGLPGRTQEEMYREMSRNERELFDRFIDWQDHKLSEKDFLDCVKVVMRRLL